VQLLADTVGVMVPPVPRRSPGDRLTVRSAARIPGPDTVSISVSVDSSGIARAGRSYSRLGSSKIGAEFDKRIRFYPARRYDGNPVGYYGLVHLSNSPDSENIRIDYRWF
jgi:hypothetical protein